MPAPPPELEPLPWWRMPKRSAIHTVVYLLMLAVAVAVPFFALRSRGSDTTQVAETWGGFLPVLLPLALGWGAVGLALVVMSTARRRLWLVALLLLAAMLAVGLLWSPELVPNTDE